MKPLTPYAARVAAEVAAGAPPRARGSRRGRPRLAVDLVAAVRLWVAGARALEEVAAGLGVSPGTLRRALRRAGVALTPREGSPIARLARAERSRKAAAARWCRAKGVRS